MAISKTNNPEFLVEKQLSLKPALFGNLRSSRESMSLKI
jgi:hypothetical protein